jgi:hypothetical protein
LLIFLSPLFRGEVGTFPNTPDNDWRGGALEPDDEGGEA